MGVGLPKVYRLAVKQEEAMSHCHGHILGRNRVTHIEANALNSAKTVLQI